MGKGTRSPGGSLYDRLLVPRIESFALNNDHTDEDAVVEYLRRSYKEYQRQKAGPFRLQVVRALEIISRRGGPAKEEVQLQVAEGRHLQRQRGASNSGSDSDSASSSDGGSSSGAELDGDGLAGLGGKAPASGMNRSMLSLYGGTGGAEQGHGEAGDAEEDAGGDAPAFAPPHVIAAAAARAAKESQLAAEGAKTAQDGAAGQGPGAADGGTPAIKNLGEAMQGVSAAAERSMPASTSGQPEPGSEPKTAAKPKRGGATPSERATGTKRARTGAAGRLSSTVTAPRPVRYADLGGVEGVLAEIRDLVEYPLKHPEVYGWLGVEPPRGVLLHGPPGCGKTALANAIANECGVPFLRVSAPEMVSGMSGESEAKIRQLFQEAAACAPCIVFIDEIDAIAPKRETAQREMERRIVAQMLTCLDDLSSLTAKSAGDGEEQGGGGGERDVAALMEGKHVVVIGATNRPDALDAALRRAGRFDREIAMGIPDEAGRRKILQVLARPLRLSGDFDFGLVAKRTPGFVGADLAALVKEAAALAVKRIFSQVEEAAATEIEVETGGEAAARTAGALLTASRLGQGPLTVEELEGLAVTMADFVSAISKVQPSVRREGFATTPDVTWDDVGSLREVQDELAFAITQPIANPELFAAMGLQTATGVLLFGPPGCGKTLVAKAAANDSGANFISIKGPELLNKYVGESERAVRQLFSRARAAAPCVLFFDEMDALAPRRGSDVNQSSERVVNQLLTEMDGCDGRQHVYLVGATNRPDMIDPALLRPGRFDKILYVPLPPPDGRVSILQALTRKTPLGPDVDLAAIGTSPRLTGFSGADLAALIREACVASLRESMLAGGGQTAATLVTMQHFELAMRQVQPSVSRKDQRMYDGLRLRLRSSRGHLQPEEPQPSEAAPQPPGGADDQAAGREGPEDMDGNEPMEAEA